jgi:hypothetical protein
VVNLKQFFDGRGWDREIAQANNQIEVARWMGNWKTARQFEADTANRTPAERGRLENRVNERESTHRRQRLATNGRLPSLGQSELLWADGLDNGQRVRESGETFASTLASDTDRNEWALQRGAPYHHPWCPGECIIHPTWDRTSAHQLDRISQTQQIMNSPSHPFKEGLILPIAMATSS